MGWREIRTITAKRVFSYEGWSVDRNRPYKASGRKMEAGMTVLSGSSVPLPRAPRGARFASHERNSVSGKDCERGPGVDG